MKNEGRDEVDQFADFLDALSTGSLLPSNCIEPDLAMAAKRVHAVGAARPGIAFASTLRRSLLNAERLDSVQGAKAAVPANGIPSREAVRLIQGSWWPRFELVGMAAIALLFVAVIRGSETNWFGKPGGSGGEVSEGQIATGTTQAPALLAATPSNPESTIILAPRFTLGERVIIVQFEAVMRNSPSSSADEVEIFDVGTYLSISGAVLQSEGANWWPVTDPITGTSGFILERSIGWKNPEYPPTPTSDPSSSSTWEIDVDVDPLLSGDQIASQKLVSDVVGIFILRPTCPLTTIRTVAAGYDFAEDQAVARAINAIIQDAFPNSVAQTIFDFGSEPTKDRGHVTITVYYDRGCQTGTPPASGNVDLTGIPEETATSELLTPTSSQTTEPIANPSPPTPALHLTPVLTPVPTAQGVNAISGGVRDVGIKTPDHLRAFESATEEPTLTPVSGDAKEVATNRNDDIDPASGQATDDILFLVDRSVGDQALSIDKEILRRAVASAPVGVTIGVMAFDTQRTWVIPFTTIDDTVSVNNRRHLFESIDAIQAGDAASLTPVLLDLLGPPRGELLPPISQIVLLSQGNFSDHDMFAYRDTIDSIATHGTVFSAIMVGQGTESETLKTLVSYSHGQYASAPTAEDIPTLTLKIGGVSIEGAATPVT